MATLGEAKVKIGADLRPLRAAMKAARMLVVRSMRSLATNTLKGVTRVLTRSMSKLVSTLKRMAKIIAATMIAIGIASVKAFVNFQQQLQTVNTMLTEQTEHLLPGYAKELQQLSVEFGESTKSLSNGLFKILSASIGADKAIGVLTVTAKSATAGITDTATATKAIVGVLNAYGLGANQAGKVSDILFATVKRGQTTFEELASSIGRVTAISASAGISMEEVGAAFATITRGNINPAEAVTGLRMALISLQGQSEQAIELAKEHGLELSVQSLKTKKLTGMIKQLARLDPEVFKNIFKEVRARFALNILLQDQSGFLSDLELQYNSAGETQKAFEKQTSTLGFQFRRFREIVKKTGVTIGKVLGVDVGKAIMAMGKFLLDNQDKIAAWASVALEKTKLVVGWFTDLWDLLKTDPTAGFDKIREKVTELFQQLQKGFAIALEKIKPFAVELGAFIAEGFKKAIKEAIPERPVATATTNLIEKIADITNAAKEIATQAVITGGRKIGEAGKETGRSILKTLSPAENLRIIKERAGDGSNMNLSKISQSLKVIENKMIRGTQFGEFA